MSEFPDGGDWSTLPPAPHTPTTADRAQHTPQFGASGQDDPGAILDAATNREWRAASAAVAQDEESKRYLNYATTAAARAYSTARALEATVRTILEDGRIPIDQRRREAEAAIAAAKQQTNGAMDGAFANAHVMGADAHVRAMPEPPADATREANTRQDVMMQLEGLRGLELGQAMARIAAGPDRAAAALMIRSSLKDALMNARIPSTDDRQATEKLIVATAFDAASKYGEEGERRAATAVAGVAPLLKMLGARQTSINIAINRAEAMLPRQ